MWRETIVPKYKNLLQAVNKGGLLTFEMVRVAVTTGKATAEEKENRSFFGIWEEIIYHLKTDDNGIRYTTSESYISALKSFRKIMGENSIEGFKISAAEIQKWKDGMRDGKKERKNRWQDTGYDGWHLSPCLSCRMEHLPSRRLS